jgi:hypothetical protein
MSHSLLEQIFGLAAILSMIIVLFMGIAGLALGFRISRWQSVEGAWISVGSSCFIPISPIIWFNQSRIGYSACELLGISQNDLMNIMGMIFMTSTWTGLLCLLIGAQLLAKRYQELRTAQ